MSPELLAELEACRAAEKEQALFYRGLAAAAEERGDGELGQRFHDLHADEQHHLSRLTARLVELGRQPADLPGATGPAWPLDSWEAETRRREAAELERYTALGTRDLDPKTRALVEEILEVERHHSAELGGKWTPA
jgi:rubrerythrin